MTEVVLTFETQEQADACVLALSKGYIVEQWFMAVSNGKPYGVKFYVSNNNVTQRRTEKEMERVLPDTQRRVP